MNDLIYRQDAEQAKMEFLNTKVTKETEEQTIHDRAYAEGWNDCNSAYIKAIMELPSAEPEIKPISYTDCSNAMLKMWMDNVLTDGEYNKIMEKLNSKHMADMKGDIKNEQI